MIDETHARAVRNSRIGGGPCLQDRVRRACLYLAALTAAIAGLGVLGFVDADLLAQVLPGAPRNLRLQVGGVGGDGGWPTAGGNVQRTSNSPTDVSGVRGVAWYRPIEAKYSTPLSYAADCMMGPLVSKAHSWEPVEALSA